MSRTKRIFVVAGEHSGDVLGAKLIEALKERAGAGAFEFAGVGGEHMEAAGVRSIFPLSDVAVMGRPRSLPGFPSSCGAFTGRRMLHWPSTRTSSSS